MTAQRSAMLVGLQDAHEILLQTRTRGRVRDGALAGAVGDPRRRLAEPRQARHHHRVRREGAARWVHVHVVAEPERLAEDQLLVSERRVQLGEIDSTLADASLLARELRRRRAGEVADAERMRLDAVVDAADPRGLLFALLHEVTGREND